MPTDDRPGRLYRLDTDGSVTTVLDEVGLPNGMGFTPTAGASTSTTPATAASTATTTTRRPALSRTPETVVEVDDGDAIPDGMTVDAEGYLWSARWDGGCLVRHDPSGAEVARIEFPAREGVLGDVCRSGLSEGTSRQR